ncbi:MAG: hypothetical protein ACLTSZ_10655, partial [Lachnospiraceae bacterium]
MKLQWRGNIDFRAALNVPECVPEYGISRYAIRESEAFSMTRKMKNNIGAVQGTKPSYPTTCSQP